MTLPTVSLRPRYSAWSQSAQLLNDGLDRRSALISKQQQSESNDLTAIQQVALSTEPYAKCFDPLPIFGVERERRVLG